MIHDCFKPNSDVVLVSAENGVKQIAADQVCAANVGVKAAGLACLPAIWVPNFFVISYTDRDKLSDELLGHIALALNELCLDGKTQLILRSSAINESLDERGSLNSYTTNAQELISTLEIANNELPAANDEGPMFWVVQHLIETRAKGHLSNERRLRYAKRDWVFELEEPLHLRRTTSLAFRKWREGLTIEPSILKCELSSNLEECLKRVARWMFRFNKRVHFEWVWDGKLVHIVQADESLPLEGEDPEDLVRAMGEPDDVLDLNHFRIATEQDYSKYKKLSNTRTYRSIGYEMPTFYILDNEQCIKNLLTKRKLPRALQEDIDRLVQFPLVIRTDLRSTSSIEPLMLPRSDELRTIDEALEWFRNEFREKLGKPTIKSISSEVVFILHHYVPAAAAAYCRAAPQNRNVRIESLWGLPDGLHWYSHDVYEVDTGTKNYPITTLDSARWAKFKVSQKLRYKRRFIAPNSDGEWVVHLTNEGPDWAGSIKSDAWIREIASTTRAIANKENAAVTVMWFIDIAKENVKHKVIPWWHQTETSMGSTTGSLTSYCAELSTRSVTEIRSYDDWQDLQKVVGVGAKKVNRVRVIPEDPRIFRNQSFAEELGVFARENNIVIELAGAILSHGYYLLTSQGAQVECIDLFGTSTEILKFQKLVRDKIPAKIERAGENIECLKLSSDAHLQALKHKLIEEAFELHDAKSRNDMIVEAADILEIMVAISKQLGIANSPKQLFNKAPPGRRESRRRTSKLKFCPNKHPSSSGFRIEYPLDLAGNSDWVVSGSFCLDQSEENFLFSTIHASRNGTEFSWQIYVANDDLPTIDSDKNYACEDINILEPRLVTAEIIEQAIKVNDSNLNQGYHVFLKLVPLLLEFLDVMKISADTLLRARAKKFRDRGGFDLGLLLMKTSNSQSLSSTPSDHALANQTMLTSLEIEPRKIDFYEVVEPIRLATNIDSLIRGNSRVSLIRLDSTFPRLGQLYTKDYVSITLRENIAQSFIVDSQIFREGMTVILKILFTVAPTQASLLPSN